MENLSPEQEKCLLDLLTTLIDQRQARVLVPPNRAAMGFWFGGGNPVQDEDGVIWLSGRYRNYGDSRTGLKAGERGLACVILRSDDGGRTFQRVHLWSKDDLSRNRRVLSIEGTSLHRLANGTWELFVSSEQERSYPEALQSYQKPGTGVWSIDRLTGPSPDKLDRELVSRGATWDVAATRITGRLPIPPLGRFAGCRAGSVYFYDGAECLRSHQENPLAHKRPRGYSCEELGGAFWGWDESFPDLERLSRLAPLFVSPWGTGCSRYVETLITSEGILAIWEQSQQDGSQPLVGHFLPLDEVARILAGQKE
jgi:hypothetical protein